MNAVQINIDIEKYWNYTLAEILMLFEAYKKRKEEEAKEALHLSYLQAAMVAQFVNKALNGKRIPEIHQVFPSVFGPVEVNWQQYEQQFMKFAQNHNKHREVAK